MPGRVRHVLALIVVSLMIGAGLAAAQEAVIVRATQDSVIRAGPGTSFERIGAVVEGTRLTALGRNAEGTWIHVDYRGMPGWIARFLLTAAINLDALPVVGMEPELTPEATATVPPPDFTLTATNRANLRVRLGPSLNAAVLGSLPANSTLILDGRSDSRTAPWARFVYEGQHAWVAGWLLRVDGDFFALPDVTTPQLRADGLAQLQAALDQARALWQPIADIWRSLKNGETQYCGPALELPAAAGLDEAIIAADPALEVPLALLNQGIERTRQAIVDWHVECSIERTEVPLAVIDQGLTAVNEADTAFIDAQNQIASLS